MRNVLVTGANGQLGKCIQKIAEDSEMEFHFYDSKALDITDKNTIADVFSSKVFEYCINCAAYTNVEQAEQFPEKAYAINAEGVKNIADACLKNQTVLIHISTDYVFDGEKGEPYIPTDETNPINEYGKSKLAGEKHVQDILNSFFIIRTSWLYSEFGNNFYKTILKKAKAGEDLKITDAQTGCPTDANHLARFVLDLIEDRKTDYGILHFTDEVSMTWYDFALEILKKNNLIEHVKLERGGNYRTFAARPKNSVLASL